MIKDKERARLVIVTLDKPRYGAVKSNVSAEEEFAFIEIFISIINDGGTKAFNVRAEGSAELSASAEPSNAPLMRWGKLLLPGIVRETETENPLKFKMISAETGDTFTIPQRRILEISDNTSFLWVEGVVLYDDVFGDSHRTPFCYRWKADRAEHGVSEWINHSKASS